MSMNPKNVQGTVKGFAAAKLLRKNINKNLNKTKVVINKIELAYNKDTKEYEPIVETFGLIDYNPVVERLGLDRDFRRANVLVDETHDNGKITRRRVNIDGDKYVMCTSIISIKCDNLKQIAKLDEFGYEFNGDLYRVLGASPSQQKHAVKFYYKVTPELDTEVKAYHVMDSVSGYVFTRGIFRTPVDGTKVISANTRFGNYLTGMECMSKVDLKKDYIVIIDGAIPGAYDFDEQTREEMDAKGLSFDNNINDGGIHFGVELTQEIGAYNGVQLSIEDALMMAFQTRISYITAKCMSDTLCDEDLKALASLPNAKPYGNTNGRLMLVCDTDGAKALNVTDLENGTAVLDVFIMAQAAASEPKTSGQHAIKYATVDMERTLNFFNAMTTQNLEQYVMSQIEEGKANTVREGLTRALGEEAFSNKILVEGIIKDSFTFIQSAIAKTKLSIEAIYSHMTFDSSFALTKGFLEKLDKGFIRGILRITDNGFVEAFSMDICKKYAKEIKAIEDRVEAGELTEEQGDAELFALLSGVVIKYPSAGTKEYEVVVYQTLRQIRRSIEAQVSELGLNNEDAVKLADQLLFYFQHRPWGTTTYAPLNAMKNKLAGADCDFDATMTDMSELKWILIEQRLEEAKTNPGFMGNCTYISYKDVPRNVKETVVENVMESTDEIEF